MKDAYNNNWIHEIKVARHGPSISRLMFGDDTFLFCKAHMEELQHIKHILDKYEAMSGLLINIFKSSILFPHGLSALRRRSISQI